MELLLNALAEESATQISKERNPEGLRANAGVAREGAEVAKTAREDFERRIGHSVVSPQKAIDHIQSPEELPFPKSDELIFGRYRICVLIFMVYYENAPLTQDAFSI